MLAACAAAKTEPAPPAAGHPDGGAAVAAALDAMGGEAKLRAIRSMHYKTTGTWTSVESSPRPEPPWDVAFDRTEEWLDFERGGWARNSEYQVFDGKTTSWQVFGVIAADGATAIQVNGETKPGGPVYLGDAEEQQLYQPYRLVLAAADARDARVLGQDVVAGQPTTVIAFHHHDWPIKLWLDARTHRLAAAEITHTLPDDFFWRVRGDVVDRFEPSLWTLHPSGVWFARQHTLTRNGVLYHTFVIDELDPNGATPDRFAIPAPVRAAYLATALGPAAPTARGESPLSQVASGVWLAAAARANALVIAQPSGAVLIDAPISEAATARVLDRAARTITKPVATVVLTGPFIPTLSGVREAASRGLSIRTLDANASFVTSLLSAAHTLAPDALARSARHSQVASITARTALGDGPTRVELIPMRATLGERIVLAWLPAARLLWVATALPLGRDGKPDPSRLAELETVVTREHLDVDRVLGSQLAPTSWSSLHATVPR